MKTQKTVNLLGDANNESSNFATRRWYVISDQNNTEYGEGDENGSSIKFETKVTESNLCDYSDAYILVTGNITATGGNANTKVAFKNCAPFTKCITHINNEYVDDAENLDVIMPMYILIEYSDNYSDNSGSLWQFKRDESPVTNDGNPDNVSTNNSTSFKYKSSIFKTLTDDDNGVTKNVKIAVPLKYLSNFWRSFELPLINCNVYVELNWTKVCVMSAIADTTFKITNTKLSVPIVTFSTKDSVKLSKQLKQGFKRPVYWNAYITKIQSKNLDKNNHTRFLLDNSFQGVKRLFLLAFNNTIVNVPNYPINNTDNRVLKNNCTKYFLPRVYITDYNVLIHGRNFHDYTTGCLLDYQYFTDHYQSIAVDVSKQKALDADSRAIQPIEFYGILKTNSQVCTILEQNKRNSV